MAQPPTIDHLLNLVPDSPSTVLSHLRTHPGLASKQDGHGYSLLHAATSYNHVDQLKALVREFNLDINLKDEDGETCLFNAETVEVAKELLELGVDATAKNDDGLTAAEKLADEDEAPDVAAYLNSLHPADSTGPAAQGDAATDGDSEDVHPPPPLPNGIQVNLGTMHENDAGGEPDPAFRRRIEELAARQDFEGSEGQRELRGLVQEAVEGMEIEGGRGAGSRRRLG
ncbi:uncharacterized protein LTR77_009647 [Saxophila tyrrhenica]|uniref:Ankyrin repeat protein n=1 Tax=Saxophila tyrrhenica TaxID=1690608 RepID=A0AAV9P129_9PEZI|nr:hypothetical protein LTR77_009647 [Saxophila tyrrhenica]